MARQRLKVRGFTLVELLVVIAIIGILVSLLLPAVQSAREAARRMQCGNNLKQLALAIHNYADTHKVFPCNANASDPAATPTNGFSWISKTLPFFEQQTLHDKLNFSLKLSNPFNGTKLPAPPPNTNLFFVNTVIPSLLCPTDPTKAVRSDLARYWAWPAESFFGAVSGGGIGPAAVTCYMGFQGDSFDTTPPDAIFERSARGGSVTFAQVLDGTSNVLMLGERSPSYSPWCAWAATNGVWISTRSAEKNSNGTPRGTPYHINAVRKLFPVPNSTEAGGIKYGAVSLHPGGIQVACADGSVHFLAETMDHMMYRDLALMGNASPPGGLQNP
ncbi:MAG: DUF1559 domain-containing protein [Pirellulaceae bacterium]